MIWSAVELREIRVFLVLCEELHFGRAADRLHREIVDALHQIHATTRSPDRPLRLGLFCDPAVARVPRIVKAFERACPWDAVEAAEVPVEDPLGPLRRAELDLVAAWLPLEEPWLVVGPILSHEPRVLAVAADHPLRAPRGVGRGARRVQGDALRHDAEGVQ